VAQKRKTEQKIKSSILTIFAAVVSVTLLTVFLYWYFSVITPELPRPPLKTLAANHNIALGAHAALNRLENKPYREILTSQFNFITIDGESDWSKVHPSPSQYNYTQLDKLVSFAEANNMPIQYHHLVWGEEVFFPAWLKNGHYSSGQLLSIMHDYISNVVGHYKNKVVVWTVVNEAFSRAQHINGLSDWWADNIKGGTTYIDDSFIWAHQADPNTTLILNDFENETENNVSNAMYSYIKAAKARGIPIDGIGMQMHINAADPPSVEAMIKNMQRFDAIGVPTYITEFDVNLNYVKGSNAYKSQLESQITYNVVRACIESKACVSFDSFGITDKESLLKRLGNTDSHSFLFDSRYRPKPSFYAFRQAWIEP
jgi:endo-1,4-beta-xylanase